MSLQLCRRQQTLSNSSLCICRAPSVSELREGRACCDVACAGSDVTGKKPARAILGTRKAGYKQKQCSAECFVIKTEVKLLLQLQKTLPEWKVNERAVSCKQAEGRSEGPGGWIQASASLLLFPEGSIW